MNNKSVKRFWESLNSGYMAKFTYYYILILILSICLFPFAGSPLWLVWFGNIWYAFCHHCHKFTNVYDTHRQIAILGLYLKIYRWASSLFLVSSTKHWLVIYRWYEDLTQLGHALSSRLFPIGYFISSYLGKLGYCYFFTLKTIK